MRYLFLLVILVSESNSFAASFTICNRGAMKFVELLNGNTLVLTSDHSYSEDFKKMIPLKISGKKTSSTCTRITLLPNDPSVQVGTGGNDADLTFSKNFIDLNIGDDGRSHYLIYNDGNLEDFELNSCRVSSTGRYFGGNIVGTFMKTWSSNVESTAFNGCLIR